MNRLMMLEAHEPLEGRVYKVIRESIVTQSVTPGSRIWADRLAADLGVSRTPVQAALVRLEQEGLLKTIPRRGTYVATASLEEVGDIYSLREVLEGLAARQAVKRGSDEFFNSLADLRSRFEVFRSQVPLDVDAYLQADRELHSSTVRASGNDRLVRALAVLEDMIEMLKLRAVTLPGRSKKSVAEHLQLIDALLRRSPHDAERLMRTHIASVRRTVERVMSASAAEESTVSRSETISPPRRPTESTRPSIPNAGK